MILKNMTKSRW